MQAKNISFSPHGSSLVQRVAEDYKGVASAGKSSGSPLLDRLGTRSRLGEPEDYYSLKPDVSESADNGTLFENSRIAAGWTYFGQFITHDLTISREFGEHKPRLNLNCLYGSGPKSNAHLYEIIPDPTGPPIPKGIRFALQTYQWQRGLVYDVQRIGPEHNIPVMADVRNDDNFLLSQLHCTWMRFHNQIANFLYNNNKCITGDDLFKRTRKFVTRTYQWLIINEYLELMTGDVAGRLLEGEPSKILPAKIWHKEPVLLPEFIVAALRVGHSQVRQSYKLEEKDGNGLPLFSEDDNKLDLRGFKRDVRRGPIDWQFFFHFGGTISPQKSRPMDIFLADSMHRVPFPHGHPRQHMGEVNIKRSVESGLVIHQRDMKTLGKLGINSMECFEDDLDSLYKDIDSSVKATSLILNIIKKWKEYKKTLLALKGWPLWIFLLLEARIKGTDSLKIETNICQTLGPLGAQIVGEQMAWILLKDPDCYLNIDPSWNPLQFFQNHYRPISNDRKNPCNQNAPVFSMADVIHIAEHGINSSPSN